MLFLIERSHILSILEPQVSQFQFQQLRMKGYNTGIRFQHTCMKYVSVVLPNGPLKNAFTCRFVLDGTFAPMHTNLETMGSQFCEQALPKCVINDSESWNHGFPVLGTSGSQTLEPMPTQSWNRRFLRLRN